MGTVVASLTLGLQIKMANVWRDQFNPLRGLTMRRAVAHLEEGERGAYADIQWVFRYVEKRDATLRAGKRSLLAAVTEMDWSIKTVEEKRLPKGWTVAQAEAQAQELRSAYDAILNLTRAIEFLALAEFRGFSHLEKVRDGSGGIERLEPVPQWYWCRDGINGEWTYNPEARSGLVKGQAVDLARFVIREVEDPIDEIALLAFVRKQLGKKDQDGFIESFAVPAIFAVMPPNVPQGQERDYQALAERVIGNARGSLPHGTDIKTVDAGARGVAPFRDYLRQLDEEIVLAITSSMLTMLAQSGSGTLGGNAHADTFDRVARALAKRVTETLQEQVDAEILEARFPGQPALAYFTILAEEEVDTSAVVEDVGTLRSAGFQVDPAWLKEKTGYPTTVVSTTAPTNPPAPGGKKLLLPNVAPAPVPDPAPAADAPGDGPGIVDIDDEFLGLALDDLYGAMQDDFTLVANRLQEILGNESLDDDGLRRQLEQLQKDLPGLAAQVGANDATVAAWERILGAAAANQLSD